MAGYDFLSSVFIPAIKSPQLVRGVSDAIVGDDKIVDGYFMRGEASFDVAAIVALAYFFAEFVRVTVTIICTATLW